MRGPARTILFLHAGRDWVRGSERVLLDLASSLPATRFRPVVWCNSAALRNACLEAGIAIVEEDFPEPAERPWWRADRSAVAIGRRVIHDSSASLIHVNTLECLAWTLRAARASRVPLIAHLHTPTTFEERVWSGLHQVDVVVGVSEFSLAWVQGDGFDRRATRLIRNAVFPDRLGRGNARGLRAELGIPEGAFVAATVGSLILRKDVATVIEGISKAARTISQLHLLILGAGEELVRLERLTADLRLRDSVHFLGERQDVGAILRDVAQVLISAAREEALPLNVIEAGFFGLPAVVSDIPPHHEIVTAAETGLFFQPGDPEGLAASLVRLNVGLETRQRLGQEARKRVEAEFLPDRFINEFTALYDELPLRRRRRGWVLGLRIPRAYWSFGIRGLRRTALREGR